MRFTRPRDISEILSNIASYHPEAREELIRKAYVYAARMHAGQTRRSGEPYISHPLEVAYICTQLRLDSASVATAMLHDIVEDTAKDEKEQKERIEEIRLNFGEDVLFLVESLTKLKDVHYSSKEDRNAESFRKLLISMAKDLRALLIKLADRLHNMRTLDAMKPESQMRIADETLRIYAPLANVLGIHWLKSELEDLSFKHLWPVDYENILAKVEASEATRQKHIDRIRDFLADYIAKSGIECEVYGRSKHLYSIFRKMRKQQLDFNQIYDLAAFRVIVETKGECYAVLGLVHGKWKYIQERWKDYISQAKANGYRSIHTTVITDEGEQIEIQIRSKEMHRHAEEGVAAHWRYKEDKAIGEETDRILERIRDMAEWQSELKEPGEFMSITGEDLEAFSESLYVITPRGKVVELPKGATPIDFAYYIHSEVGHQCAGAMINGIQSPLSAQLKNGDRVEIITRKDHRPSRDWLKIVVTGRARSKIQAFIRTQERSGYIELGKNLIEKQAKKHSTSLPQLQKSGALDEAARHYKLENAEELFRVVGIGKLEAKTVLDRIEENRSTPKASIFEEAISTIKSRVSPRSKAEGQILVEDLGDVLAKLSKCCSPLPGDPITGFIVRGEGVIVHHKKCPRNSDYDPERRVNVAWGGYSAGDHEVLIKIVVENKVGMLTTVSGVITRLGINISDVWTTKHNNGKYDLNFLLNLNSADQLKQLSSALKQVTGVLEILRGEGQTSS